ncbi:MAG: hypothetical protein UR83_C0008G0014 [Candidatus Moranbacteria bacterium GW2011_GWF2_35_54]|nr:MAG: hypothetical protein UR83_C0008G0014 [Candidatus Moranbacteria bacterium GW2011_GWF2_35_54]
MDSKIKRILEKMEALNIALKKEHARLAKKYGFYFSQKKIVFLKKIKIKNKRFRIPVWKYVIPKNIRDDSSSSDFGYFSYDLSCSGFSSV